MNTFQKTYRMLITLVVLASAVLVTSCKEDDALNFADQQSVISEAATDSYFEEGEDIASLVSFADNSDFGRTAGLDDARLACATITLAEGSTETAGTITIDFGDGCTVGQIVRKGKIIITYEGMRRQVGSAHSITFEDFYVNDVKIEGTRTVAVSEVTNTSITHEITLTGGKIIWNEGSSNETSATRTAHHYRRWQHNGNFARSGDEVHLLADGTAAGVNRNGTEYSMQINDDIVFKADCMLQRRFLPVSGEKVLLVGGNSGREITVNYGSEDCDNKITVTINGESKEVTVTRG